MDNKPVPNVYLKPALTSIAEASRYLGISRAKLYSDLLPQLQTVHIGGRHLVVVESMDRLIAANSSGGSK